LTVSLTIAGSATINATSFDAGSYDNCCLDRFEVKRMGEPDSEFGPTETFTCSDGNDSVLVIVRVYDCEGNYNECMVQVDVQDKLPPNMICPPMKTLGCKDDVFNFVVTGNPIVVDACPLLRVNFSDVDMRDRCGIGKITRT